MTSTTPPAELVAVIDDLSDNEIQKIRRGAGVGASEIAAVLGASPWLSELELYALKRGDILPWEGSRSTDWGKRHEATIVAKRAEKAAREKLTVVRPGRIYRSTRCRAMFCSPDAMEYPIGMRVDLNAPVAPEFLDDAKTADSFDKKEWKVRIPPQYVLQLQAGAYVLGAERVALDVLFGGNDYQRFEMAADFELGEMLASVATDFMARVEEGRPPAAQPGHTGTASLLAQLYHGTPKQQQTLSLEAARKLLDIRALMEQRSWADEQIRQLQNEVRLEMGNAVEGVCPLTGKVLVSWSAENEQAVEVSIPALREQHPHLYRMVERRVGRPAGRSTRINLRRKALEAAQAELTKEQ